MIKIYGIKNCDSVKKALTFFKKYNLSYQFIDYKNTPLASETIEQWVEKMGIDVLFNARSTTYRELGLKDKNLDAKEKKEWLCKKNLLIKRPIVEFDDKMLVGFNEENYQGAFNE
ncbi:MAG: arsenate reductase family protein [Sulfurimonadaceae bacterium]|jgi:Spx/MgsR family transcriptional regulator|nr:arsenate reductase family protein [Sulfurimonadaceae bacterium]